MGTNRGERGKPRIHPQPPNFWKKISGLKKKLNIPNIKPPN
jgi:hypothetical protein